MSREHMYSIYDDVADQYSQPMPARNQAVAARYFLESKRKLDPIVAVSLSLFYVGDWDDNTGLFSPCDPVKVNVDSEDKSVDDLTVLK